MHNVELQKLLVDTDFCEALQNIRKISQSHNNNSVFLSYKSNDALIKKPLNVRLALQADSAEKNTSLEKIYTYAEKIATRIEFFFGEPGNFKVYVKLTFSKDSSNIMFEMKKLDFSLSLHKFRPVKFSQEFDADLQALVKYLQKVQATDENLKNAHFFEIKRSGNHFNLNTSPKMEDRHTVHVQSFNDAENKQVSEFYEKCRQKLSTIEKDEDNFSITLNLQSWNSSTYTPCYWAENGEIIHDISVNVNL